jgi:hypothetical protein
VITKPESIDAKSPPIRSAPYVFGMLTVAIEGNMKTTEEKKKVGK